ncbi:DUF5362 family protein [Marinifilum caeruleilacunae]|uniref:DUF5362 domain-containing protein n=1 Tax=Marinifilum caeruleilacunae TaxID=2499076 RepID=A0ABX1WTU6_9BACT|nr:DUF5362 family protein [Marinifilum caeruleilacunae]NOU59520.1 hypothetical protein [Marinifilum caeruleilacunae]
MQEHEGREAKPIELNPQSVIYLNDTRKWTMFFSILGFIMIALLLIGGIFMASMFGAVSGGSLPFLGSGIAIGAFYLFLAVLYFFPILYLYKFSKLSKDAIYNEDSSQLSMAFRYLKLHYKFLGILSIVILSLYVLIFLIAAIVGGFGALM